MGQHPMTPAALAARAREVVEASGQPAVIAWTDVPADEAASSGLLAGLSVAVKDNIDVAGVPTTAADPRRTTPAEGDATVVARLRAAGAAIVAKTNMDQYATGLVGTRTPYGACHSVFSAHHVSGGSSSGSGVAVALGAVDVALGTDTAGSGRVPAAFNGIVGWKPTKGLVPTTGVLPACPSLDCVTAFTRDVTTARRVSEVMAGVDADDPWSRPVPFDPTRAQRFRVVAVPSSRLDLDDQHRVAWRAAVERLRGLVTVVEVDVSPMLDAATLLYQGPWVAERFEAFGELVRDDGAGLDPTVAAIVRAGGALTAAQTFAGFRRLQDLAARARRVFVAADALMLPVTPTHPTLDDLAADPIGPNTRLGTYTNMVNLLDLCGVAVPAGLRSDGLPFGVQFLAPAFADRPLLDLAAVWTGEDDASTAVVPSAGRTHLAVIGAHLSGCALNEQLTSRGGRLAYRARTAPVYRMVEVAGGRPGLVPDADGHAHEAEVWDLPTQAVGELLGLVEAPLALGRVRLDSGRVPGFVFAGTHEDEVRDLSHLASWRQHVG